MHIYCTEFFLKDFANISKNDFAGKFIIDLVKLRVIV